MADIRLSRRHKIYQDRQAQILRNEAAWRGGAPYIALALTRYPHESDASWVGDPTRGIVGRATRTSYINYAGRIVSKINQYVFGQDTEREGIGEGFRDDATKAGQSIGALMEDVCSHLTTSGWCWLQADRSGAAIDPETGRPRPRSLGEREQTGDRVFWQLWPASEVVDWRFGVDGELDWLITEQAVYQNEDVMAEPKDRALRTVWKRGRGTRLWYEGDQIKDAEEFTLGIRKVPFEPVGLPRGLPWWFDDVERVQAGLLNLESAHMESMFEAVFPQLVVPAEMMSSLMGMMKVEGEAGARIVLEMIRGLNHPILEPPESKNLTRYIMPDQANLKTLPDEILRRRRELFEVVGLAMANKDTAQVQSADSKAWDHLDPASVMRARAVKLEEAERKMVTLSRLMDPEFAEYAPAYPRTFNLVDFAADIRAVIELDQAATATELRRELERIKVKLLAQRFGITAERMLEIMASVDEVSFDAVGGGMPWDDEGNQA